MRILLILIALVVFAGRLNAQLEIEWEECFGEQGDDYALDAIAVFNQSTILVGYTENTSLGTSDGWVLHVDSYGDSEWEFDWGGDLDDGFRCISNGMAYGGGYIIAGATCSFGAGESDGYLLRIPGTGASFYWTTSIGGPGWDEFNSIYRSPFLSGYIAAGSTTSWGSGDQDAWLVKVNNTGEMEWYKTFGGEGADFGVQAYSLDADGFILFGNTNSSGSGSQDAFAIHTDVWGNVLWEKTYGSSNFDQCTDVIYSNNGGYVMCGFTSTPATGDDVWLVKLDDEGNVIWENTYGGIKDDRGFSVCETLSGYLVVGRTASFGLRSHDIYLVRTDHHGNLFWDYTYGGVNADVAYTAYRNSYQQAVIAGATQSWGAGCNDLIVLKTSSLMGIEEVDPPSPPRITLSPNPCRSVLSASFSTSQEEAVSLQIFDLSGRLVDSICDDVFPAGENTVEWTVPDDLQSGCYVVNLSTKTSNECDCIVLLE